MHDSGKRQQFATGAVRDAAEDKAALELMSPFALGRLGAWLAKGAQKYSKNNWLKGMPVTRCVASLLRHTWAYMRGDNSEDHLAACMCNSMFLLHYDEMIKRGWLPGALDDRPNFDMTLGIESAQRKADNTPTNLSAPAATDASAAAVLRYCLQCGRSVVFTPDIEGRYDTRTCACGARGDIEQRCVNPPPIVGPNKYKPESVDRDACGVSKDPLLGQRPMGPSVTKLCAKCRTVVAIAVAVCPKCGNQEADMWWLERPEETDK